MDEKPDPSKLTAILASLGRELRRPLDSLQEEIERLLVDHDRPITEAQRLHIQTMLALCDDLRKLTADCLGEPSSVAKDASETG